MKSNRNLFLAPANEVTRRTSMIKIHVNKLPSFFLYIYKRRSRTCKKTRQRKGTLPLAGVHDHYIVHCDGRLTTGAAWVNRAPTRPCMKAWCGKGKFQNPKWCLWASKQEEFIWNAIVTPSHHRDTPPTIVTCTPLTIAWNSSHHWDTPLTISWNSSHHWDTLSPLSPLYPGVRKSPVEVVSIKILTCRT